MQVTEKFAQLQQENKKALLAFLPGNFPTSQKFKDAVRATFAGGADILEIGIPFSEPLADGEVIANAYGELIKRQENFSSILKSVQELHSAYPDKAFVVMTYANPFLAFAKESANLLTEAGVSGIIVPDVPFEERKVIEDLLPPEVKFIPLLAPTTSQKRRQNIVSEAQSFVYCVAVTGITGERKSFAKGEVNFLKELDSDSHVPIVIGFGISQPEHARVAAEMAAGVVIGTKLVKLVEKPEQLEKFIAEVVAAMTTI